MTDQLPLMPRATAVWLVENTTLSFRQIADFVGMHELEIAGIADGDVADGIRGLDPVMNNQLDAEEIKRCEAESTARLKLKERIEVPEPKRRRPRYTPVSRRQDRPSAIAWLVRYHPEMEDSQIAKLIGTTRPTIQAIRTRTHWNSANIQPVDPVALGLCTQVALDAAVRAAAEKKAQQQESVPTAEERISLMPVQRSLGEQARPAASLPSNVEGFESFSLDDPRDREKEEEEIDPESLFNLPSTKKDDDDD